MDIALAHWSHTWPVLLGYGLAAAAHLIGLSGLLARGATAPASAAGQPAWRRDLRREAAMFHVGLLMVLLALVSPIAYWSDMYIWVRGVQDLMLAVFAPALIVLGAPWLALRQCWRHEAGGGLAGPAGHGSDRLARVQWPLAKPVAAVVAFNVIWLGWHLPVLFDLAHTSRAAGFAEYATYLGAGTLLWLQLIGSRPYCPPAAPLRRVALLTGTLIAGTVLGMVLVFGSGVLYLGYGGAAHHVLTVIDDQQLAGAVLWAGMLPPAIIAAVALFLRWLNDEESAEVSAGLDRLLTSPTSSWHARSGLR